MSPEEGPQQFLNTNENGILNRRSEILVRLQNLQLLPGFDHAGGMVEAVSKLTETTKKAQLDAEFERIEFLLPEAEANNSALVL